MVTRCPEVTQRPANVVNTRSAPPGPRPDTTHATVDVDPNAPIDQPLDQYQRASRIARVATAIAVAVAAPIMPKRGVKMALRTTLRMALAPMYRLAIRS